MRFLYPRIQVIQRALDIDQLLLCHMVVPPKVEYTITKRGKRAITIVETIRNYGLELMKEFGIEHGEIKKHKKDK